MPTPVSISARTHRVDQRVVVVVVLVVATLAWLLMWRLHGSGHGSGHASEHHMDGQSAHPGTPWGVWLLGWAVMVVAMMLPPALPLLRVATGFGSGARARVTALATGFGFLAVWLAAGVLLLGIGTMIDRFVRRIPVAAGHPQWVAAAAVAAAGLFQFTSAKRACLTACRGPRAMAMTRWRGDRSPVGNGARLGVAYGAVCVGCCWALMVLTLAVGSFVLPVMVVVGLAMAGERLLPAWRPFVPLVGVTAVGLAGAVAAGLITPGFVT